MENQRYPISKTLDEYVHTLKKHAYSDIEDNNVNIEWGKTQAYAVVIWSHGNPTLIRCNRSVRRWPEPALLGLLAHELSHIALGADSHNEHQTDRDVISRGLGPYLGIERVFTNKYSDHVIQKGRDRYLGYDSIRLSLTNHEINQLDALMADIGVSPRRMLKESLLHDYAFHEKENSSHIVIDGQLYPLDKKPNVDEIKLIVKDSSVQILSEDMVIGENENGRPRY
ncbi:MAG: hypothetical protein P1Q69_17710 [Candidatus Thorarchaeota archaeon]|nr:hypothetical protein [Candidatus Thorarchaeota archaeon]